MENVLGQNENSVQSLLERPKSLFEPWSGFPILTEITHRHF